MNGLTPDYEENWWLQKPVLEYNMNPLTGKFYYLCVYVLYWT
jgi:hypothetical protein